MSSDHRKLTSVDTLIRKEVGAAVSKRCVHQIPVLDVPRSPVFGSHDPIHLPWGDFAQVTLKNMHSSHCVKYIVTWWLLEPG